MLKELETANKFVPSDIVQTYPDINKEYLD